MVKERANGRYGVASIPANLLIGIPFVCNLPEIPCFE